MTDVVPGYNVADFLREGFATVRLGFFVERGRVLQLADVTMFSQGAIAGSIVGPDGEPVQGAIVFACQTIPPAEHRGSTRVSADPNGRFRVSADPAFYQVFAYKLGTSLVGEGEEGGLGATVLVNPGATANVKLKLRNYNVEPDDVLRTYGPDC